jgi:hypothetical protein
MTISIDTKDLSEEHPIAIHKLSADRVELLPGKRTLVSLIVFPRRTGLQSLKYFKIIDDALRDRQEHKVKGHSFTFPKFQVVEQELPATQTA